jgi:hypothetical protein
LEIAISLCAVRAPNAERQIALDHRLKQAILQSLLRFDQKAAGFRIIHAGKVFASEKTGSSGPKPMLDCRAAEAQEAGCAA